MVPRFRLYLGIYFEILDRPSGGFKGVAKEAPAPPPTPSGKSWIRHCCHCELYIFSR